MGFIRRLALPVGLALTMVLVLSGSVAAASTTATTLRDTCTLSGGAWGYGRIALRVKAAEQGLAGVNRILFTASLMHQSRAAGGSWSVNLTQQRTTEVSPTATGTRSRTWSAVWFFGNDTATYRHRIEMRIDYMTAKGVVVATRAVIGSSC